MVKIYLAKFRLDLIFDTHSLFENKILSVHVRHFSNRGAWRSVLLLSHTKLHAATVIIILLEVGALALICMCLHEKILGVQNF